MKLEVGTMHLRVALRRLAECAVFTELDGGRVESHTVATDAASHPILCASLGVPVPLHL